MPEITISVSEETKRGMDEFPEMNWSAVACRELQEKVNKLRLYKSLVTKSKLTEKNALEIGSKVSEALHERYKQLDIE